MRSSRAVETRQPALRSLFFHRDSNSPDNGCAGLIPTSGKITIRWKTNESITNPLSTVTIPAGGSVGGVGNVGALRATFNLRTGPLANGAASASLSVSGGLTGGDGGANSGATAAMTESVASIVASCGGQRGLKQILIGVGALSLD